MRTVTESHKIHVVNCIKLFDCLFWNVSPVPCSIMLLQRWWFVLISHSRRIDANCLPCKIILFVNCLQVENQIICKVTRIAQIGDCSPVTIVHKIRGICSSELSKSCFLGIAFLLSRLKLVGSKMNLIRTSVRIESERFVRMKIFRKKLSQDLQRSWTNQWVYTPYAQNAWSKVESNFVVLASE